MSPNEITARLEQAGACLLALRLATIGPAGYRSAMPDVVREASASYGWSKATTRPAIPNAAEIDRMDEALAWVSLIPEDRYVLRRICNARALVSPTTQRHLFTWSQIARLIGADRKAVQRWHQQGIAIIAANLKASPRVAAPRHATLLAASHRIAAPRSAPQRFAPQLNATPPTAPQKTAQADERPGREQVPSKTGGHPARLLEPLRGVAA